MAQVAEITFGQKVMEKETEKRISEIEGEQARNPCPLLPQTLPCGRAREAFPLPCLLCSQTSRVLWNIPRSLCSDSSFGEMQASVGLIFHFSHSSDLTWMPSGLFRWAGLRKKGKHVVLAVLGPEVWPGSKPGSQGGAAAHSPASPACPAPSSQRPVNPLALASRVPVYVKSGVKKTPVNTSITGWKKVFPCWLFWCHSPSGPCPQPSAHPTTHLLLEQTVGRKRPQGPAPGSTARCPVTLLTCPVGLSGPTEEPVRILWISASSLGAFSRAARFLFLVNTRHQVLRQLSWPLAPRPPCRPPPPGALLRLHSENPPCFPGCGPGVALMRLASPPRTGRKYQQLCISS